MQCETSPGSSSSSPGINHPVLEKLRNSIPPTVQRPWSRFYTHLKGPEPPRPWKIRPFLPRLQQLPLKLVDKVCPRQWQRVIALGLFYICWIATFAAVLHKSSVAEDVNGYGQPTRVSCGGSFWYESPALTLCIAE